MKKVLVVGGGPAGLVTAKSLLQRPGKPFNVTLFEKAEGVGGMWRPKHDEEGEKCNPGMRTNLSRFTVSFSDLSWHDVELDGDAGPPKKGSPPMFPRAHQVGRYLEEYARRFVPDVITCRREVKHAELSEGQPRKWNVTSVDRETEEEIQDTFDFVIIASGFFDLPKKRFNLTAESSMTKQHSSKFRSVSSWGGSAGNVVVIGGGISGSEAAATAAFQISNAKHTPGKSRPPWSESKVYHVFDRPFYCLPRYLPQNPYDPSIQDFNLSPKFLPLDLVLYNLSRRPTPSDNSGITASIGTVPPQKAKDSHGFIRKLIGGDQRELGHEELVSNPEQTQFPSFTGISDTYSDFVRDGLIIPIRGRASQIITEGSSTTVNVSHDSPWALGDSKADRETIVDNVRGIIEATGFEVHLDYLSADVKANLEYDATCPRLPFLLSRGSIFNNKVPELGFVGFYEGPYWGVMEMQARLVAQKWDPQPGEPAAKFDNIEESRGMREIIKSRDKAVPQFWMMDYVGLVEELSRSGGIVRHDTTFNGQSGPAFPARYADQTRSTDHNGSMNIIQEVKRMLDDSDNNARFVAAAAFRGMQGKWTLNRKITSRHASSPGGHFAGTASYHPRNLTSPSFSGEYLYIEEGTFTMTTGFSFPATRRYVYRYNEKTDQISTYFVQEDGQSAEKIFNQLKFKEPDSADKGWIASSDHWCDPDTYKSSCEYRFRGAQLGSFGITYVVSGPNKDYTHESWYERPAFG
jgi:hypothetical protein